MTVASPTSLTAAPPLGLLLDVDGPIASPVSRSIAIQSILDDLVSLTAAGEWMPALGYLALTLVLGLGAAALGLALGKPTPVNPPDHLESAGEE